MTFKRRILSLLTRAELQDLSRPFDLDIIDRRSSDALVDALAHSKRTTLPRILPLLSRRTLKGVCRECGLSAHGREKSVLIRRLLQRAEGTDVLAVADGNASCETTPSAVCIKPPNVLPAPARKQIEEHYIASLATIGEAELRAVRDKLPAKGDALRRSRTRWKRHLGAVARALMRVLDGLTDRDLVLDASERSAVVAALYYFVEVDDLIPDYVCGTGFLDDAHVLNLCLKSLRSQARDAVASIVMTDGCVEMSESDARG